MLGLTNYSESNMQLPPYKFVVEYEARYDDTGRILYAKFTNEKHAKAFAKRQRTEGLKHVKLYQLTNRGTKGKEVRFR